MKEKDVQEKVRQGWLRAIVTFEIVGKPKEHIEKSMTDYIENIKADHRIIFLRDERGKTAKHKDGMFSTFCEAEMLINHLETLTWLCVNFSPASVEIIEPDRFVIEARDVTNWQNDLLSKLHEIGTDYRTQKAATEHVTVAMNQLIQNAILLCLRSGPKKEADLERETGIYAEQLAPFLKHLTEKGKIEHGDAGFKVKQ